MSDQLIFSDNDPIETREWLDAIDSVIKVEGPERARYLVERVADHANTKAPTAGGNSAYCNTISTQQQAPYPGDLNMDARIRRLIRWNAIMMVLRSGKRAPELGGHIASYQSAAVLYEIGFSYFWRDRHDDFLGDLVFFQGHSAPGIYSRAYLEGRINEEQLNHFRQEVAGNGLSSYPHPWLMPDFWQFPTVSMGLGPIQAIYQARFLRYMEARKLQPTSNRKVWMFCGDGEMDEPESLGALSIAAREKLDNLIFVINCNLQRLDGPVRGNSNVVQEMERIFLGNGWHVIKVLWASEWDELFAKDHHGLLQKRLSEIVDGEYQNFAAKDGAYIREHLFNSPELKAMVAHLSDDQLHQLRRGGHDPIKVYNAYKAACEHTGQPTLILAKTVKGYGMGEAGEAQNITHQQKKMSTEHLKAFVQRFELPLTDQQVEELAFYKPNEQSDEIQTLHAQRQQLGGYIPTRHAQCLSLPTPTLDAFQALLEGSGEREISTTMAFVRTLGVLLKDKALSKHLVPIAPDEFRTFGMEGLFRQIGIYSPLGQRYEPMDKAQVMFYHEKQDGQLLEEGINEAGAFSSWLAAATSYSVSGTPMIPFYIYYSMFGFQRIMDLAWAAGDSRARGFLLGATAGKTTLAGEGLQHTDSHSHIFSSVIPNCISYDPTFSYELAVIIRDGIRRMYENQEDIFYYITVMNENYAHPAMPKDVEEGIIKGMYRLQAATQGSHPVQLLGCGTILREAIKAAQILAQEYDVAADVWSVTSFTELRREAMSVARHNQLHPLEPTKTSYVQDCLNNTSGPVMAVTDYMRLFADQIRPYLSKNYHVLGTDGFGRSDTRANLRHHFEVDAKHIVYYTLCALKEDGIVSAEQLMQAQQNLDIDPNKPFSLYE